MKTKTKKQVKKETIKDSNINIKTKVEEVKQDPPRTGGGTGGID